jgi:hypothetical protein
VGEDYSRVGDFCTEIGSANLSQFGDHPMADNGELSSKM